MADLTDHTGLTVSDMDAALRLWRDIFGFTLVGGPSRPQDMNFIRAVLGIPDADVVTAWLVRGERVIELVRYIAPAARGKLQPDVSQTGFVHVAVSVPDLAAAEAELRAQGAEPSGPSRVIPYGPMKDRAVRMFRHPNGIVLEIFSPA